LNNEHGSIGRVGTATKCQQEKKKEPDQKVQGKTSLLLQRMSTDSGTEKKSSSSKGKSTGTNTANLEQQQQSQLKDDYTAKKEIHEQDSTDQQQEATTASVRIPQGKSSVVDAPSETALTESPRQVIAVSASKSPAAFFNLARKFLVTNEMCDLSALEGAIVSAVDAAHLLERSKLATIVRYDQNAKMAILSFQFFVAGTVAWSLTVHVFIISPSIQPYSTPALYGHHPQEYTPHT
jgi:hypothetical protein